MKITMEHADIPELEIIIRGDLTQPQVPALVAALQNAGGLSKLFLYDEDKEHIRSAQDVDYFEANGNKVFAHLGSETLETRYKLYELAEGLRARGFVQISKGVVVNSAALAYVEAEFSGNYTVFLKNKTKLSLSRKFVKQFRQYIMEVAK